MPRVGNCQEMIKRSIFNKVDFQIERCIPHMLLILFHWIRPKSVKKRLNMSLPNLLLMSLWRMDF